MNLRKHSFNRRHSLLALAGLLGVAVLPVRAASPDQSPIRVALIESLSGPIANTGEAVHRNLVLATERVNARGGVKLAGGRAPLAIER